MEVVLENVFGIMGTVFWSFQLAPQVHKNWRKKSTKGLAREMILLWIISSVFFGVYAIILGLSIPLVVQPQIFATISLIVYVQCFYYRPTKFEGSKIKSGTLFVLLMMLFGGVEAGGVYIVRYANTRNVDWVQTFVGIIPVVLLVIGFVPQYIEIYQLKRVIGISLIFMSLDILGGLFSLLSLVFRPPPFDILASFTYLSVVTLDLIIVFLYFFLNWYHSRKESVINNSNEEIVNIGNEVVVNINNEEATNISNEEAVNINNLKAVNVSDEVAVNNSNEKKTHQ
ncbi:hypothetical protein RclHR1_07960004 [Rhizophagus clarus]|uniref:Integral membrane protein n=1 Tax=Rhizophagus clarus TaxID=94130 RepID=A0A2Z6RYP6_9GLOM|nr:hypothetical protein RclHR1_07960004 [Rhizophagus clarus]GES77955.1 integral membrane protein [Rhizophagus clarus]